MTFALQGGTINSKKSLAIHVFEEENLKIFCMYCFNRGIQNGSSIYRPTPIMRKRWTKPENYYVLSPDHVRHEGTDQEDFYPTPEQDDNGIRSRTTVPAWMLHGIVIETILQFLDSEVLKGLLDGAFERLAVTNEDESLVRKLESEKEEVEAKVRLGITELLNLANSPHVQTSLRAELAEMDKKLKEIDQEIEDKSKEVFFRGKFEKALEPWKYLLIIHEPQLVRHILKGVYDGGSQLIDHILVSKYGLLIHFSLGIIGQVSLPAQITKEQTKYEVAMIHRYQPYRIPHYSVNIGSYVPKNEEIE